MNFEKILKCKFQISKFIKIKNLYRAALKFAEFNYLWRKSKFNNDSVVGLFERTVGKYPNKVAMYYQNEKWTFKELDEFSNRVANCFNALGFKAGDEIALLMNNKPEYIGFWLGLAKAGIITALINTNNRMDSLINSLTAFNCKAVIYDAQYTKGLNKKINSTHILSFISFYSHFRHY